eukprot:s5125_g4.t1
MFIRSLGCSFYGSQMSQALATGVSTGTSLALLWKVLEGSALNPPLALCPARLWWELHWPSLLIGLLLGLLFGPVIEAVIGLRIYLYQVLDKMGVQPKQKSVPAASVGRVSFAPTPKVVPARNARSSNLVNKFPALDASVVAAALAAGVPEENLTEMQRLIGAGGKMTERLREPALRSPGKREIKQPVEPLDESEDEVEPGRALGEPGLLAGGEPATMEGALSKLTELVTLLSADKLKRAKTT